MRNKASLFQENNQELTSNSLNRQSDRVLTSTREFENKLRIFINLKYERLKG